ncbi:MAG: tRNA pseudouridine(55) synthase [bacterium]|nr:tRNA pseudouridine(55) synthase [bacterium]
MAGLILPIDKPAGWTSFDVVAKLRGGLKWRKVGHAGTLDPMATGLLLVMCGDATGLSEDFMNLGKRYRGTIRLGVTTESDDLDGRITNESAVTRDTLLITEFLETCAVRSCNDRLPCCDQSRRKRSYKQVLRGKEVDLASRPVEIYMIRIIEMHNPEVTFDIACGKGTHVRSIARFG